MEVVLFEPKIPPNTGNVARLCAGLGVRLNLIEPLAFKIDDKHVRRAGLDYWPFVDLKVWANWEEFLKANFPKRVIALSARKGSLYYNFKFEKDDLLLFGAETTGLPPEIMDSAQGLLTVPILPVVRSLNLATTVGMVLGEGLRQVGFNSLSVC